MNLTNYHSHSTYCDGHASIEEFIQEAIQEGFYSYGMSSHAPLPFSTHWNMERERMSSYLEECSKLKEKYRSKIEFYTGLEIDYLSEDYNPSTEEFTSLPLDYRIGSVHLLQLDTGEYVDIDTGAELFAENVAKYFNHDYEEVIHRYFKAMRSLIEVGHFDILGHCDKINKNSSACAKGICESSFYRDLIRDYFEFIARCGCMVEINTKAYNDTGMLFPNESNFAWMRELDIPVLVNSDSHRVKNINAGRKDALKALTRARFDTVRELHKGAWVDVPIAAYYR